MTVQQFVSISHTFLDRFSALQMDDKPKRHLLLCQALLPTHDRNMAIGAASGSFDITSVASTLRSALMNGHAPLDASMAMSTMTKAFRNFPSTPRRMSDTTHGPPAEINEQTQSDSDHVGGEFTLGGKLVSGD